MWSDMRKAQKRQKEELEKQFKQEQHEMMKDIDEVTCAS